MKKKTLLLVAMIVMVVMSFAVSAFAQSEPADNAEPQTVVVGETEYDLSDYDSASEYVGAYADNLSADENFDENIEKALATVRGETPSYATFWALVPPIIAIVLALITKEVYSSLFIGILSGGLIYSSFNLETTMTHVFQDGFISTVADSYNIGILIFLVLLGSLVAMINKNRRLGCIWKMGKNAY